jgi:hypothetical protein
LRVVFHRGRKAVAPSPAEGVSGRLDVRALNKRGCGRPWRCGLPPVGRACKRAPDSRVCASTRWTLGARRAWEGLAWAERARRRAHIATARRQRSRRWWCGSPSRRAQRVSSQRCGAPKNAPRRAAPPSRAEAAAAKNRGTLRRIQGANPRIHAWSRPLMTMPSRPVHGRAEGATRPGRKVEEDGAQPGALGEPSGTGGIGCLNPLLSV